MLRPKRELMFRPAGRPASTAPRPPSQQQQRHRRALDGFDGGFDDVSAEEF
eukprot:SAG31_NODE_30448_length_381_cov_0.726950_1_plen_50_part_10